MNSVKLQDAKSNIQKYVTFLYANNKLAEREIKKIIPLIMASKKTKYEAYFINISCSEYVI